MSPAYPHISPFVFVVGTLSFFCSLLTHIAIWRNKKPLEQMLFLAIIFIICPFFIFIALNIAGHIHGAPGSWFVTDPFNISYVFIWHLALSAAYIMSYPASQAECPSLKILLAVEKAMPAGLTAQEIKEIFPPDSLINDRLDDLNAENFMKQSSSGHVPTTKGRILRAIYKNYRRLLGLPRGEG